MDRVIALREISVTALFYLDKSRKIHLGGMRACRPKDVKKRAPQRVGERERASECTHVSGGEREPFGSSFYVFFLPPGLPYANWA